MSLFGRWAVRFNLHQDQHEQGAEPNPGVPACTCFGWAPRGPVPARWQQLGHNSRQPSLGEMPISAPAADLLEQLGVCVCVCVCVCARCSLRAG